MARKDARPDVSRRKFLAGVAVAGAATTVAPAAKASPGATANKRLPSAVMPNTLQIAAETGGLREPTTQIPGRPASDYMVDVIKSMKIEYIYSNPASSFRGLHEFLINYGKNTMPEFLTVTHEEASVAMCHGHFKATGKPQMAYARHRRPAARRHGGVQRLGRPRAADHDRRQRSRRLQASAGRADGSLRAGHQRAGARLHQVGRPAGLAAAFLAVVRARLQICDDPSLRAGDDRARRRRAAGLDQARREGPLHAEIRSSVATARRSGRPA